MEITVNNFQEFIWSPCKKCKGFLIICYSSLITLFLLDIILIEIYLFRTWKSNPLQVSREPKCFVRIFVCVCMYIYIYTYIHSLIIYSVLRQVHSRFQSEFSTECVLVLRLSITLGSSPSCLRLLQRLPATHLLTSIFSSITCFSRHFLSIIWPIQLAFLTFGVQDISLLNYLQYFFISHTIGPNDLLRPLQHHISKLPRYIWSTFLSVQFSVSYEVIRQV
jgi:hypothetical protein